MSMHRLETHLANILLYGSVAAVLVFFYIPIATLIVFSFTESRFLSFPITSFSLRWYGELFASKDFWPALTNSALLAFVSRIPPFWPSSPPYSRRSSALAARLRGSGGASASSGHSRR